MASNMRKRSRPSSGNDCEGGLATDQRRSLTSSSRPSLTSPTPSCIYKRAPWPRTLVSPEWQSSALSSPPSRGEVALWEILCHTEEATVSVPMYWTPFAAITFSSKFFGMPLPESPSTEVLLGPPKDLPVDAFGSALGRHSSKITAFNPLTGFPEVLCFYRGRVPHKCFI